MVNGVSICWSISLGVCNDIHIYGDKVNQLIGDDTILQLNDGDYELFDDEGEFVLDIHTGSVKIRGHHFKYEFSEEDYANNGIEVKRQSLIQEISCVCLLLMMKLGI